MSDQTENSYPTKSVGQKFTGMGKWGRRMGVEASLPGTCQEAVKHAWVTIQNGKPWPVAIAEATGLWTLQEELFRGKFYRYLVQGEAFDWALLVYRLLQSLGDLIPPIQREELLKRRGLGGFLADHEIKRILGTEKYSAYLNYWYGITLEIALQTVVLHEIRKERIGGGRLLHSWRIDESFRRIYGEGRLVLINEFRNNSHVLGSKGCVYGELKEFTYWLFKLRLNRSEKARVASDTRKALEWMKDMRSGNSTNELRNVNHLG